nr:glycine zipper 2TM domain-containing protein [Prochlorococcus marinus]
MTVKFFYLAFLFCFSSSIKVYATPPKSVTCTRTEYREEYIPGTKSNPGYVRSYEVDVEIPCGGSRAERIKDDDCTDGKIAGALLGGGVGGAISRKEGRWWAVPLGAVTGAAIGCQVDGG